PGVAGARRRDGCGCGKGSGEPRSLRITLLAMKDNNSGFFVSTACIWEALSRKPGNVHPGAPFNDVSYVDFLLSAAAIGPLFFSRKSYPCGVGLTVKEAV